MSPTFPGELPCRSSKIRRSRRSKLCVTFSCRLLKNLHGHLHGTVAFSAEVRTFRFEGSGRPGIKRYFGGLSLLDLGLDSQTLNKQAMGDVLSLNHQRDGLAFF